MRGKKVIKSLVNTFMGTLGMEPLALWLRLQSFLSNPKLANMPGGGLKEYVIRHNPNCRDNINHWWNELKEAGYLKKVRYPYDHNKFKVDWFLFDHPVPVHKIPTEQNLKTGQILPAMRNMQMEMVGSAAAVAADRNPAYASEPKPGEPYTFIPMDILQDERIPLLSLGIYIVMRQLIDSWELADAPDWEITKSLIRHKCGQNPSRFHTAWMILKKHGYLDVLRGYCKKHRRPEYQYRLYPLSDLDIKTRKRLEDAARRPETGQIKEKAKPKGKNEQRKKEGLEAVTEEIQLNIEYDLLLENRTAYAKERGLCYDKDEVDGWLRLIVDTIRSSKPHIYINKEPIPTRQVAERFRQLKHEHILYVMEAIRSRTIRGNARSYKLTCLYNALDTLSEHEMGSIKYSMD